MVEYRSYSQLSSYQDCPHQYYRERILREWQRPAAWFPHGTAVHTAAEAFHRSGDTMTIEEAQDVFRESYAEEVSSYCAETPNFEYWFKSGRYGGEEDIERRYKIGLEMVETYIRYYTEKAPDVQSWLTPDGEPAIELPFKLDLFGVEVRGKIDRVEKHPEHGIIVDDLKTGVNPGSIKQLATYKIAVNEEYGTEIESGVFWMAKKGGPTKLYDLSEWDKESLAEEYHEVDEGIRAERFDPKPDLKKCSRCSVETSCPFSALRG